MQPSELRLGDIIFFQTKCGIPEHVAMFTGFIDGKPHITHSVINNTPGLQTTILKAQGRYDVFRPVNSELAESVVQRMLEWAKYNVPYDNRRKNDMLFLNDGLRNLARSKDACEPIDYVLEFLIKEAKTKFYERIKFAARRDTCPVKLLEGVKSRGFNCVQVITLAFQVEELSPYVKTIDRIKIELACLATTTEEIQEFWISDKHCPKEILNTYDLPSSYVKYANALRDKEELADFWFENKRDTPTHPHYHPSLVAWRFDIEPDIDKFIESFNSVINLPAKFCFTDALYALMQRSPQNWQNMGVMNNSDLPLNFSPQEKELHRKRSSDLGLQVMANRADISRERALSPLFDEQKLLRRISSEKSINGAVSPLLEKIYPRYGSDS